MIPKDLPPFDWCAHGCGARSVGEEAKLPTPLCEWLVERVSIQIIGYETRRTHLLCRHCVNNSKKEGRGCFALENRNYSTTLLC